MSIEDRVKALEREVKSLDTQVSWMIWTRVIGALIAFPTAGFLVFALMP